MSDAALNDVLAASRELDQTKQAFDSARERFVVAVARFNEKTPMADKPARAKAITQAVERAAEALPAERRKPGRPPKSDPEIAAMVDGEAKPPSAQRVDVIASRNYGDGPGAILKALEDGPLGWKDLLDKSGMSKGGAHKAIAKLLYSKRITKNEEGKYKIQ